jgi:L-alanine-DL-glutamate epimerase-like enolase superfamily enzyme
VADIAAIHAAVDMECMDLLQAAHSFHMAQQLVDYGRVGFLQIDCGRIGGIGPAKRAADYAAARGVTYVNHTFTSHTLPCAHRSSPMPGSREIASANTPSRPRAWPGT